MEAERIDGKTVIHNSGHNSVGLTLSWGTAHLAVEEAMKTTQARYAVKLRFLLGLAKRMNEATGNDAAPPVMVEMGELAAFASLVENML